MYSSAAVIVGFCPGVPVYKGITMVLSLFRSHSWLVVVYCLVFCSGSCEPVHLDRTNSCSKEHYVCVYSSFLMWKSIILGRLGISIVACVVTVRMSHIYIWMRYNLLQFSLRDIILRASFECSFGFWS